MTTKTNNKHVTNQQRQSVLLRWFGMLAGCILLTTAGIVNAAPLPADLQISTSVSTDIAADDFLSFDEDDSSPATGNATHTGSLVQTIGGASSTTTINDISITSGSNPLSGTLTDVGDGWEIHSDISGSFSGTSGAATNNGNFYDLFFNIQNLSATDSIQVTISLDYDNHVHSSGPDAFAASEFQLFDGSDTELFFSDLTSDTLFGNAVNGNSTGAFGGTLDDTGIHQLILTLTPGELLDFHVFHSIEGGAYASGSSYSGSFDAIVSFDATIPTNQVAEPGLLALMGFGLLGMLFGRRIWG